VLGLIVSVLFGALVGLGFWWPHHSLSALIVWGLASAIASFVVLGRRAAKRIEPLMAEAQKHVQAARLEKAVETLRRGFEAARWHPLLGGQLHAQIGILLYVAGQTEEALPHLSRASRFVWVSSAMLGCYWFRKKDEAKMKAAFEKAVRSGKKDSLAWTVYAYCLRESGQKDASLAVLERGAKAMKKPDHRLSQNLERTREGKPLKTAPYGEQWIQFRLDKNPPPMGRGPRGPQLDPNHPALRGMRGRRARHM
jgi:tetratricopeptide (TPR) repeat protein